jgi:hypothetical protein
LLPEARLKLALQYLIASMLDAQPAGGKVTLLLGEGPAGTVLRAEADPTGHETNSRELNFPEAENSTSQPTKHQPTKSQSTKRNPAPYVPASVAALRRIRLAIASRLLEGAGAALVFGGNSTVDRPSLSPAGFVLRIAHRPRLSPS